MRLAGFLILCCVAVQSALADYTNLTLTVDGITYSNVTFGAATPSSVSVRHSTGVASIPLEKLPPELQKKFGYNPQKATQYRAAEQIQRQKLADQEAARRTIQTEPNTKQGEITGAFGVTLGTKVDLSRLQKTTETTDKIPMYGFAPDNPVQGLTRYYCQITPKTGIIYCVWAIGDCENTPSCVKQQAVVVDILKKKYGHEEEQGLIDTFRDTVRITGGRRSIIVKCSGIDGLGSITLNLYYIDSDLQEQAEKERIELEGKKIDGSGL